MFSTDMLRDPSEECLARALKTYGTTPERFQEKVLEIQQWFIKQPHLPDVIDIDFVRNLLIKHKCSVQRTEQTLDMNYTLKTAVPEFFSNRDPLSRPLQDAMDAFHIALLPRTTKNGYRVIVVGMTGIPVKDSYSEIDNQKLIYMIMDMMILKDRSLGTIIVADMKNLQLKQLRMESLTIAKKIQTINQAAYVTRMGGMHYLNAPTFANLLIKMLKALMPTKLASRVFSHSSLESLHEHVDRAILPRDYGGDETKTLAEFSDDTRAEVESKRDWFLEQEKTNRVEESKRPGKRFNHTDLFGFEGSFKQLAFD